MLWIWDVMKWTSLILDRQHDNNNTNYMKYEIFGFSLLLGFSFLISIAFSVSNSRKDTSIGFASNAQSGAIGKTMEDNGDTINLSQDDQAPPFGEYQSRVLYFLFIFFNFTVYTSKT